MGYGRRILTAVAAIGLVLGLAAAPAGARRGAETGPAGYDAAQQHDAGYQQDGSGMSSGQQDGSGMSSGTGYSGGSGSSKDAAGGESAGSGSAESEGADEPEGAGGGSDAADVCKNLFGHEPTGDLTIKTTPAEGATVRPGEEIVVDLTWSAGMLGGPQLHGWASCVAIDGEVVEELSVGEGDVANTGSLTRRVKVPQTAKPGSELCTQAVVVGQDGGVRAQRRGMGGEPVLEEAMSDCPCYTVGAAIPAPPALAPEVLPPPPAPEIFPPPPAPQVLPAVVERAPEAVLPVTGPKRTPLVLAGMMLLLGGLAVIGGAPRPLPSRQRRTT